MFGVWSATYCLEQAWDMGDPDQVDDPFDYDQELADQNPEGLSRKDQMVSCIIHQVTPQLLIIHYL